MAEPFLAEIRLMSFNHAPKGWAMTNGQFLPINQNQALFALLGTTFGGNGQTTFALPDFRGRAAIHVGAGHTLGEAGGQEVHTLTISELPTHVHLLNATSVNATSITPSNSLGYARSGLPMYGPPASFVAMSPQAVGNAGGSQAHPNMQPYITVTFCIALQGLFPSPN
jgi:microcystin-dependent protein